MPLLDNMPHSAVFKRRTRTMGPMGGSRDTFTQVGDALDCWRQGARESEKLEFAKRGISVTNKIYFPSPLSLPGELEEYILVIGDDTYEVRSEAVPDASAGLGVLYRVMAEYSTTGSVA